MNNLSISRVTVSDIPSNWEKPDRPTAKTKQQRSQDSVNKVNVALKRIERALTKVPPGHEVVIEAPLYYRGECKVLRAKLQEHGISDRCVCEEGYEGRGPLTPQQLEDLNTVVWLPSRDPQPLGVRVNGTPLKQSKDHFTLVGYFIPVPCHWHVVSLNPRVTDQSANKESITPASQQARIDASPSSSRSCHRNWKLSFAVVVISAITSIFASIYAQQQSR